MLDDGMGLGRSKVVRRTSAKRAAIVVESYEPGATVASVAHKHEIVPSQLSSWRTAAKRKVDQDKRRVSDFATLTVAPDRLLPFDRVEVACGPVLIRLPRCTTPKRIADIAQRLVRI